MLLGGWEGLGIDVWGFLDKVGVGVLVVFWVVLMRKVCDVDMV